MDKQRRAVRWDGTTGWTRLFAATSPEEGHDDKLRHQPVPSFFQPTSQPCTTHTSPSCLPSPSLLERRYSTAACDASPPQGVTGGLCVRPPSPWGMAPCVTGMIYEGRERRRMKYLWNKRIPGGGGGGGEEPRKRGIAVPTWVRSFSRINVNHNFLDDEDSRRRTSALSCALAREHAARDGCSSTTNGRALVFHPSSSSSFVVVCRGQL